MNDGNQLDACRLHIDTQICIYIYILFTVYVWWRKQNGAPWFHTVRIVPKQEDLVPLIFIHKFLCNFFLQHVLNMFESFFAEQGRAEFDNGFAFDPLDGSYPLWLILFNQTECMKTIIYLTFVDFLNHLLKYIQTNMYRPLEELGGRIPVAFNMT